MAAALTTSFALPGTAVLRAAYTLTAPENFAVPWLRASTVAAGTDGSAGPAPSIRAESAITVPSASVRAIRRPSSSDRSWTSLSTPDQVG